LAWLSGAASLLLLAGCMAVPVVTLATAIMLRPREAGEWVGSVEGVRTEISFDRTEGTATVKTSASRFGLKAGEPLVLGYEIDDGESPMAIDFVVLGPDGKSERVRFKGIMNFISDDVLTICVCLDGTSRPETFKTVAESNVYSLALSKVK
jgi:hypothetical protein